MDSMHTVLFGAQRRFTNMLAEAKVIIKTCQSQLKRAAVHVLYIGHHGHTYECAMVNIYCLLWTSQPLTRCCLVQPRAVDQLEAGGRLGLPQEGGRQEGQRRPGDPLLPAGGHGNVRVCGREPPRHEHGEGEALLLR